MSLRVLICDDTMFMRTVIAKIFREAGHEVVGEAETGDQAVEQYRALQPDVVTMDVIMPNLSGIEAVAAITAEFPEACIVMCSAMGQERLIDEAMAAGASAFVVKPFDAAKLLHAIEDARETREVPVSEAS